MMTPSILTLLLCMILHGSMGSKDFGFYDDLKQSYEDRTNSGDSNYHYFPLFNGPNYIGRNLHKIDTSQQPIDGHESLLYCHIPTFLRYSNPLGPSCGEAYSASAGALLAMHHFNTGDGSIVSELDGIHEKCNIRFTTEMVDTGSSPISAIRSLTRMITRPLDSLSEPQPCAVLGCQISETTSKLASLTGVYDLFQVSSSALSVELENSVQYPLFARSHTDVAGFGKMSACYLHENLGINRFGILFPNDAYGLGFQQSVLLAAADFGMEAVSSPYMTNLSSKETFEANMKRALEVLQASGYNYFIAAFYPEMVESIMGLAYDMGLAGPGKFWLMSGTADTSPHILSGQFVVPTDSSAAKAIEGSGLIFCKGGLPGVGGSYDRFTREWRKIGENEQVLDFINSKQPLVQNSNSTCTVTKDFFQDLPHHIVTFTYDAIIGLGLSACKALDATDNDAEIFTGKLHRDTFFGNSFRGASGDFKLRPNFPTRTADSSYFVMVNMVTKSVNETHTSFEGSPVSYFWETSSKTWSLRDGNAFIYSGGTIYPPTEQQHGAKGNMEMSWVPIAASVLFATFVTVVSVIYVRHRYAQTDSVWNIDIKELHFDDPPKIIGRGTFGLVLLAHYRGTEVAVKRVLPSKDSKKICGVQSQELFDFRPAFAAAEETTPKLISRADTKDLSSESESFDSDDEELAQKLRIKTNTTGLDSISFGKFISPTKRKLSPNLIRTIRRMDEYECSKRNFVKEMRTLSKLRHPCITTVMGAVLDGVHEPMLVMEYMDHGSLYDILHNRTIPLEGETILPLLKDVSQGLRFLHTANPQVIHGDLKTANVLVDSKFRAKVADFGMSQKNRKGIDGTPYWMSPELLRGESENTAASDVYAFGIILFEVYSRQTPYEGENYEDVIKGVKDPNINKRPPYPSDCPAQIRSLMDDCLVGNPKNRPTFTEIDERIKRLDTGFTEPGNMLKTMQKRKEYYSANRTDRLLLDVFPRHIAETLRNGKKVEPTTRELVTIFFSDIIGFTTICSTLDPMKISDMLDRLYNAFDYLTHKYDVFKVETIGDAYMAVTNLVKDQPDHVKRIADFSFEALQAASRTLIDKDDPSKGYVQIRIGFHSGPVVANVVGSRNPRYCLFGDTVNTASRMESTSSANRIHCSEKSAQLLRDQNPSIELIPRGWIDIKGKGEMKTFWVK